MGGIDATIAAEDAAPLRPGGDPLRFTVTLTNTTADDIPDVGLVVSLGHCSCGRPGASMMPSGTMRMRDPQTNAWTDVPYVREGTGADVLGRTLVPPFVLGQGQTLTYDLEMRLDPDPAVTAGTSQVNVAVKTAAESGTAASLPISVERSS